MKPKFNLKSHKKIHLKTPKFQGKKLSNEAMEEAEKELERRSKFLSNLIQKKKAIDQQNLHQQLTIKVKASDMPIVLQNKAFKCAKDHIDSVSSANGIKIDSKRLALALKKVILSSKTLVFIFIYVKVLIFFGMGCLCVFKWFTRLENNKILVMFLFLIVGCFAKCW